MFRCDYNWTFIVKTIQECFFNEGAFLFIFIFKNLKFFAMIRSMVSSNQFTQPSNEVGSLPNSI